MSDEPKFKFPEFYCEFPGSGVLEDLIPKICGRYHVTLLAGEPYVGKTRLALQIAHCLAHEELFFWTQPIPKQKVIYFTERSVASVKRDALDRNLDMSGITVVCVPELPDEEMAEFEANRLKWLRRVLTKSKPDVIFLDTMGHFLPSHSINDYIGMLSACMQLQRLCLRLKVTAFLVHHYAKDKGDGNGYKTFKSKSSGTASIAGSTLSIWGLEAAGPIDEASGHSDFAALNCLYHHAALIPPIYFKSTESGVLVPVDHDTVIAAMMPPREATRKIQIVSMVPYNVQMTKTELAKKCINDLKVSRTRAYNLIAELINEGELAMETTASDESVITRRLPQ